MNRKEFLVQLTGYGAATAGIGTLIGLAPCCAVAQTPSTAEAKAPAATPSARPPGTPVEERVTFAQTWAKRMMDNMDTELDEETRKKLIHAQGRSCYRGSPFPKSFPGGVDGFIAAVRKWEGSKPPSIWREGDIVYFNYVQNPAGLKVADGWCLCPLVEKGPDGLSGTYCECSVGYVTEMFTGIAGKPVRVELLESLKRGGKSCRFKINLA